MVYLFVGEDSLSKDAQLKKIKEQFLAKGLEDFNLDILYAGDTTLKGLQERLLCLPSAGSKRLILIKQIEDLGNELKGFILGYIKKPNPQVILVLDALRQDRRDLFLNTLIRFAKVFRFKEEPSVDTFALNRQISLGRPDFSLRILNQLLKKGERPERILGGLRYAWERNAGSASEMQKRLKLLVNCDLEIKTGRLKAPFALEKLVVCLCSLLKPSR
ncbi:MAG: hypothetical protein QME65_00870 [Candidatus Omnitrophota bacterium]|nr:hypothetical protein [Candidatus Omnitrophota bacterium]